MVDGLDKAPVIPGPGGARRTRIGEPGHLERLVDSHSAYWPAHERAEVVPDRSLELPPRLP